MTDSFRRSLAELRRRDLRRRVFGASMHRYRSVTVGSAELASIEATLGAALPPEYRQFLLDGGYGAGPYYGVWSPSQSLAELQNLASEYEAEVGVSVRPAAPFPLTNDDLQAIEMRFASGSQDSAAERDWPCSGCLPICDQGCTFWSVLVLSGEYAGRVWGVACFEGFDGEWMPARRAPGLLRSALPHRRELPRLSSPPSFGEWFAGWVERCQVDLSG